MKKTCPAGKCKKCMWYREWRYENSKTGEHTLEEKCSLEVLLTYLPQIVGAIDGLQGGVNEARNRSIEAKDSVNRFGQAAVETVGMLTQTIKQVHNGNTENHQPIIRGRFSSNDPELLHEDHKK